ncbi:MAG: hypothetical protein PVI30_11180 [Myxococcales bacterium]
MIREPHLVVLTRNGEFHLQGRRCVALRDRRTGEWETTGRSVDAQLRGCRPLGGGALWPGAVRVGAELVLQCSDGAEHDVGEVLATERPGPAESERLLEEAQEAAGGGTRSSARRFAALTAISGLLPWLSPQR